MTRMESTELPPEAVKAWARAASAELTKPSFFALPPLPRRTKPLTRRERFAIHFDAWRFRMRERARRIPRAWRVLKGIE